MIPGVDPKTDLYNTVTMKNPLDEDFVFGYDNKGKTVVRVLADGTKERYPNPNYNKEGNYMIKAGETRNFPKFIARTGIKHLIDKILLKKDDSGKFVNNESERDMVAKLIFVKEEKFDRPVIPSDMQIVDQMNAPSSDLDRVLDRNKESQKSIEPDAVVPAPVEPTAEKFDGLNESGGTAGTPTLSSVVSTEGTEVVMEESKLPSREKMVEYAKTALKIDPGTVMGAKGPNKGKTIAQIWETMTDEELYTELQIGEGDL